jgi:hypothetical protein
VKEPAEKIVKDIRCMTRRKLPGEEKIRIVIEGLREQGMMHSDRKMR